MHEPVQSVPAVARSRRDGKRLNTSRQATKIVMPTMTSIESFAILKARLIGTGWPLMGDPIALQNVLLTGEQSLTAALRGQFVV